MPLASPSNTHFPYKMFGCITLLAYLCTHTIMKHQRNICMAVVVLLTTATAFAQYEELEATPHKAEPLNGLTYKVETQGGLAKGATPLWLNANKHGLSSLKEGNGYLRGSVIRPIERDEGRKWGIGYGIDLAMAGGHTSPLIVQQAYAEGRWLHGTLTIGAKERPMELKNDSLSSGSQTLGSNARPVPQVRLALEDYWTIPGTRGWLHLKGHVAYGWLTDEGWQHDFTRQQSKYADGVLYHSKAGYLKLGNEEVFCPWSLEVGLEMASLFGGESYKPVNGQMQLFAKGGTGLGDYWRAFIPGGAEPVEQGTAYENAEGDQLGSWVARINYDGDYWGFSVYADKFFEDHSAMFQTDYNGYGTGDEWNKKKDHRYFIYDFKDWMLGLELRFQQGIWLNNIVLEYLYTKYQSGPIYHDHTTAMPDHVSGKDNFYNHYIYSGWQHWGQVIGNPLYRSPLYNTDGTVVIQDNRFIAYHLGFAGSPQEDFSYRVLATYQEGWGTYESPYTHKHHNVSILLETTYRPITQRRWLQGTAITLGLGADFGSILGGPNYGAQLTISKSGLLNL